MSTKISSRRARKLRVLTIGLTQAGVAAGLVQMSAAAAANTTVDRHVSIGKSWTGDWTAESGGNIKIDANTFTNLNLNNDRGVGVWSAGGHADDGHDGGAGGTISLVQVGNLAGTRADNAAYKDWVIYDANNNERKLTDTNQRFSSVTVLPMVFALSQGGAGGDHSSWRGPGGSGNHISFSLHGSVSTTGANYAGVWLSSTGMLGGWGGSDDDRANYLNAHAPSGGDVNATLVAGAAITTNGRNAAGLVAESVGASGGGNWSGTDNKYPSRGGQGGASNGVSATNQGMITTLGDESSAMILQSIGGQGSQQQADASWAHNGGAGGNAMPVAGTNSGTISTSGFHSYGAALYSVGGLGSAGSQKSNVGSGSYAGDNGAASSVHFLNDKDALISTSGDNAYAVLAQSVGGGIAAGYLNPLAGATSGKGGNSGAWGHGGDGSKGGAGGSATVSNLGTLLTRGDDAIGILAQSLGGLGGDGGDGSHGGPFIAVSLGGAGGTGGASGGVTVNNQSGSITTHGDASSAIVAQSIGGGGGAGGVADAKSIGIGASVTVSVGGSGGTGGLGGAVTVNNNSALSTDGESAIGISAQSIGGGGGHGGSASAAARAFGAGDVPAISASVSVGGTAGSGAHGGAVSVGNTARIATLGTSAHGISGQSIGGGGGDGGDAASYVLSAASISLGSSVSVGASGGEAGHSSTVNLSNAGAIISTQGSGAYGMYGLSVGGGGGGGGNSTAQASIYKFGDVGGALNLALGGSGGGGGDANAVVIRNDQQGIIGTSASFASGIVAQSIGGGGGNGGSADSSAGTGIKFGDSVSGWLADSKVGRIIALQAAVGGKGGSGGHGAAVTVTNAGNSLIQTQGPNAHGVFAQSIGGGGGSAGGYTDGGDSRLSIKVGVGGSGGGGGAGGLVTVSNQAGSSIVTLADGSHGVFAQSVGGGGGNGGTLTTDKEGNVDYGGNFVAQVKKVVGYDAFNAWAEKKGYTDDYEIVKGLADVVQGIGIADKFEEEFKEQLLERLGASDLVANYNKAVDAAKASGELDEDGKQVEEPESKIPNMALMVGVGGSGGSGGVGGAVSVSNGGVISTLGNVSHGVFAQSVGGGGGVGGLGASSNKDGGEVNLNLTLGGSSGGGGNGSTVTVDNAGQVATLRSASYGLFAQSVGGGGGVASGSTSPETKKFTANVGIGGSGGSGGAGGSVTVTNTGTIQTAGEESHALVAQSVGGGGGAVVMNLGDKSDLTDDEMESIKHRLDVTEKIATVIGAAGAKVFKTATLAEHVAELKKVALEEASFTVQVGATGGSGGRGGVVTVNHGGGIETKNQAALGILAQSVGGGGGLFSKTGSFDDKHGHAFAVGGKSGSGNDGGTVTVNLGVPDTVIVTHGQGAHGVLAQSIGGGGGYLGRVLTSANLVADVVSSGNGGNVTINSTSISNRIVTNGAGANGLFAQSLGGGGAAWANTDDYYNADATLQSSVSRKNASGSGGAINIDYQGSIQAAGVYANAILAQSGKQMTNGAIDPASSGGPISIRVNGGEIIGGDKKAAAIRIDGGSKDPTKPNSVFIGSQATVSAKSNVGILAHAGGVDHVVVTGTLIGDVILTDVLSNTAEQNNLTVRDTGVYQSTTGQGKVTLGKQGANNRMQVLNGGVLDVGGKNHISSLTVTGGLGFGDSILAVDVDVAPGTLARTNDTIYVTDDIDLNDKDSPYGTNFKVNVVSGLLPGQFDLFNKTPVNAGRVGVMNGGIGGPFVWSAINGGRSITPSAQFVSAASGAFTLSPTQTSLLQGLQQEWDASNGTHAALFGSMANIQTADEYQAAVSSLSTDGYHLGAGAQLLGASTSMSASMSCPTFSGASLRLQETQCVWGRISGSRTHQDGFSSGENAKLDQTTYRMGAQWEIKPTWFFGVTGAYVHNDVSTKNGYLRSRGEGGDFSVALKHQMDNWLFAVSGHLGYSSYDTKHNIRIGSLSQNVKADQKVWTTGMRLRTAYQMEFGNFYVRPHVDLDAVHTYSPSFSSSGDFLHSYHFGALRKWTFAVSPAIEAGTRIDLNEKTWVRPFVSVGATFLNNSELSTTTILGDNGANFTSTHRLDKRFLDLGAGVQMFSNDKLEVRAEYKARIGDHSTRNEVGMRLSYKF